MSSCTVWQRMGLLPQISCPRPSTVAQDLELAVVWVLVDLDEVLTAQASTLNKVPTCGQGSIDCTIYQHCMTNGASHNRDEAISCKIAKDNIQAVKPALILSCIS